MIRLSPAFTSSAQEYFISVNDHLLFSGGFTLKMEELPEEFKDLLWKDLNGDRVALRGLKKLNLKSKNDQILEYYRCNYSSFDHFPDITSEGKLGPKEYIECPKRSTCLAEGEFCKIPANLTKRQAQVAKMIALGTSDKVICSDLNINQNTLRSHKNSIEAKIGKQGKVSIATWALSNNFIQ